MKGYRGRRPSLRDSGQLEIAEQLCALAHPSLKASLELPAGDHGQACDIGFFGPQEIVDTEIDRLISDFQGQYRRNSAKRDYLAARHQRPVRLVMVVEDTERNRAALAPHLDFIRSVLPAPTRDVLKPPVPGSADISKLRAPAKLTQKPKPKRTPPVTPTRTQTPMPRRMPTATPRRSSRRGARGAARASDPG